MILFSENIKQMLPNADTGFNVQSYPYDFQFKENAWD